MTGVVELEGGLLLVGWLHNKLVDPGITGENHLPVELPAKIDDQWRVGALLRLQALFEARFFDNFAIACGPSVAATWSGSWAFHVGLVIRPSVVFGFGPL
jgi:hypothetical protein